MVKSVLRKNKHMNLWWFSPLPKPGNVFCYFWFYSFFHWSQLHFSKFISTNAEGLLNEPKAKKLQST